MARGKTLSAVFKANHQHQLMAFPPSLDELVATGHPVRVVHEVLEKSRRYVVASSVQAKRDQQLSSPDATQSAGIRLYQ
jgi:hypothetical protein